MTLSDDGNWKGYVARGVDYKGMDMKRCNDICTWRGKCVRYNRVTHVN